MPDSMILRVTQLTKTYKSGSGSLTVLKDVTFEAPPGGTIAIVGPSGSGKTTLLGLCAGLDTPTSGTVELCGTDVARLDENARASLRNEKVGFVFQTFNLIPTLTTLENVMVPAELRRDRKARARAQELLNEVGLGDRGHHYPAQLSGGEQQRVGMARAFINRPAILFADEPTGNLDAATSATIENLLLDLNREAGTTLITVTHDLELAARASRILSLKGGAIASDTKTHAFGPINNT